ncbi:MAG: PEP-CTERM sorting domain-containing protein [Armatimonadetes bacterium]|nr:PEP-CTERM sorting domain-containing protein [Armatimonadota bacterium]
MLKTIMAAVAALFALVVPAQAAEYTTRAIVTPEYSDGATAINSIGQVIYNSEGTNSGATLWSNGTSIRIPLTGSWKTANDINNSGQIVGQQGYKAFSYQNGTVTQLSCPYYQSLAWGINATGLITGYANTGYGQEIPCIWESGVFKPLNLLTAKSGIGYDVDDSNKVVGKLIYANGNESAVVWENNVATLLSVPVEVTRSQAVAINKNGTICGSASWNSKTHAVIWRNGVMIDLGIFAGNLSSSYDINDFDQVVGCSTDASGYQMPFIWDNGVLKKLPVLAGLHHGEAQGINNSGQIVGYCALQNGRSTAVLWEAVPEPSSIIALLGALAGLIELRRRKA